MTVNNNNNNNNKAMSWRLLIPCCIVPDQDQHQPSPGGLGLGRIPSKPKEKRSSIRKQSSFHRLVLSDLSNPNSTTLSEDLSVSLAGSNLYSFTLQELRLITQHFTSSNFLGEGGFGPVHKGFIDDKLRHGLKAQAVAVKLLDLDGSQGHREWLAEVIFLGQLRHPHLVKLIGYCCEDEHRLLVYEYMPRGSLENQLFRRFTASLPWLTRMKIAVGAAKGLAFLHEAEKPVIYRDFKASNILLDSDFTAKLSDFGLAKDGPEGDDTHVSTRVMGTQGYAAPEYIMTGHLTAASDVYSFGVVLLELLTGRRSMDKSRGQREQNLAEWARPQLTNPKRLSRMMDPRLEGQYSEIGAQKAAALAYQCLSLRPKNRPSISTVVKTLEPLMSLAEDIPVGTFVYTAPQRHDQRQNGSNYSPPQMNGDRRDRKAAGGEVMKDRINGTNNSPVHHHHRRHKSRHSGDKTRSGSPRSSSAVYSSSDPNIQKNLSSGINSPMHLKARGA